MVHYFLLSDLQSLCWRFLAGQCFMVSRHVEVDRDQKETLIENNQCQIMHEVVDILKTFKSSIENYFHQFCFDAWVSHKLSKKKTVFAIFTCLYLFTCKSLLKHNEKIQFLKQTVIGNEKWILSSNMEWNRSRGKQNEPPMAGLHPEKVMLCILQIERESSITTPSVKSSD